MIAILTPTYNRSNTLPRLYQSLLSQTNLNFEWLIIDDGSTDNTKDLVKDYINQNKICISYHKKENGGKHTALNLGFKKCKMDWIFLVDSDDWLENNAIERITQEINTIDDKFSAICFLKKTNNGTIIGDKFPDHIDSYLERVYIGIKGDKADVFRKTALNDFEFPEFPNENFMSESPLFIWLSKNGKTRYLNYDGYFCEYQIGGLSNSSIKNRHRCVNSTLYVYEVQYHAFEKFSIKFRSAANWWRFRIFKDGANIKKRLPIFFLPFGILLYIIDKFNKN